MAGAATNRVAVLLVAPGPLSVELIAFVVLLNNPPWVPVTTTVSEQLAPPASAPPENVRVVAPDPGDQVPPQALFVSPGVDATCDPVGSGSTKLMFVRLVTFGFEIENVNVLVPFKRIVGGAKPIIRSGATIGVIVTSPAPLRTPLVMAPLVTPPV